MKLLKWLSAVAFDFLVACLFAAIVYYGTAPDERFFQIQLTIFVFLCWTRDREGAKK